MKRFIALVCAAVVLTVAATPVFARDNAVMESRGYYLTTTTTNRTGTTPHGALAPLQTFELVRPDMASFRIGRVYTSCPCVELSSPKKAYARGERAIFELVNVKPTPLQGHTYALYVQVTSPVRATLRFDTFMQTGAAAPVIAKPEEKNNVAEEATEKVDEVAEKATQELDEVAAEAAKEAEAALAAAAKRYAEKDDENPYRASTSLDDFGRDGTIEGSDVTIEDDDVPLIDQEPATKEEKTAEKEPEQEPESEAEAEVEEKAEVAPKAKVEEKAESLPAYAVDQRIGLITLGVSNLDRSRTFYEALGWKAVVNEKYDGIVFFQLNGQILALYPLKNLLEDQNRSGGVAAPGGITLAINVREKDQVDKTYLAFLKAGATSLKAPAETPWGATTCYVADPDGHPWEITWAPQMAIDEDGELWIK